MQLKIAHTSSDFMVSIGDTQSRVHGYVYWGHSSLCSVESSY